MARTLARSVYLRDPDGKTVCVEMGTEPPEWARSQIGDHAYEVEGDGDEPKPATRHRTTRK